jgi:hypothetical protein
MMPSFDFDSQRPRTLRFAVDPRFPEGSVDFADERRPIRSGLDLATEFTLTHWGLLHGRKPVVKAPARSRTKKM